MNPLFNLSIEKWQQDQKELISSRQVLFEIIKKQFSKDKKQNAQILKDPHWDSKARDVANDEWISCVEEGYITILENPYKSRFFRVCLLQQGSTLRIGIRIKGLLNINDVIEHRIYNRFGNHKPIITELSHKELFIDWHFDATNLYINPSNVEDTLYNIRAVFEIGLQSFSFKD